MLKYWNRLIEMPDSRLTKQIFYYDWEKCKNNLCSKVKDVPNQNSLDVFMTKSHCDIPLVTESMDQQIKIHWYNDIQQKPKLGTYCTFKNTYEAEVCIEKYLMPTNVSSSLQMPFLILFHSRMSCGEG